MVLLDKLLPRLQEEGMRRGGKGEGGQGGRELEEGRVEVV